MRERETERERDVWIKVRGASPDAPEKAELSNRLVGTRRARQQVEVVLDDRCSLLHAVIFSHSLSCNKRGTDYQAYHIFRSAGRRRSEKRPKPA